MKFTKIISSLLAIGVLILFIKSYQNFKNLEFPSTQLVMFKSLSFYMSTESFEKVFGEADKVVEETEMAYRDTWRAEDPYFYKTGRLFYYYENMRWKDYTVLVIWLYIDKNLSRVLAFQQSKTDSLAKFQSLFL